MTIALPQYFGKRVSYITRRNGDVEIMVRNSLSRPLGGSVISREQFERRPVGTNAEEVAWACQVAQVSLTANIP